MVVKCEIECQPNLAFKTSYGGELLVYCYMDREQRVIVIEYEIYNHPEYKAIRMTAEALLSFLRKANKVSHIDNSSCERRHYRRVITTTFRSMAEMRGYFKFRKSPS